MKTTDSLHKTFALCLTAILLTGSLLAAPIRTDQEAITAARAAAKGKIEIPDNAPVSVTFHNDRGVVTVIFRQIPIPDTLHGDYHAYVELDITTGETLFIAGS
jgi:hypothetical protein